MFEGVAGYGNGEQQRDFIYVKDVVKVNLYLHSNPQISGIFKCGTGVANTFNAVAESLILAAGSGSVEYISFPEELKGKYQNYTQADTATLFAAGYNGGFMSLKEAISDYFYFLESNKSYLYM